MGRKGNLKSHLLNFTSHPLKMRLVLKAVMAIMGALCFAYLYLQTYSKTRSNFAYSTIISSTSSLGWFKGIVTLATSIRAHSDYPVILLVEGNLNHRQKEMIDGYFDEIFEFPEFAVEFIGVNNFDKDKSRFAGSFVRMYYWTLNQYDAITHIDSDCIVTQNIDELFDIPGFVASREREYKLPKRDSAELFNAGMFKMTPSEEDFDGLVNVWKHEDIFMGAPDQTLLNIYFEHSWVGVRPQYNVLACCMGLNGARGLKWAKVKGKIIHFTRTAKPWETDVSEIKQEVIDSHKGFFYFAEEWKKVYEESGFENRLITMDGDVEL